MSSTHRTRRFSATISIRLQTPQAAAEAAHGPLTSTSTSPQTGFWKPIIPLEQATATMLRTSLRITKTQPTSCGLVNTKPTAAVMNGPDMDVTGTTRSH